jgi:hypothetical protein
VSIYTSLQAERPESTKVDFKASSILIYLNIKHLNTDQHLDMATQVQKNLQDKNAEYASGFTHGDLALPPAKKYLLRKFALCSGWLQGAPYLVTGT